MSALCWVKSEICHSWVAKNCWQTESWLVSQSSFPQSPWWKMFSQCVRWPDHVSLVTAQSSSSAKPNGGRQEKKRLEWWVQGGNEKYDLTCHESDRAGISRDSQLFFSCQGRAVGVIRQSTADLGQGTVKPGRFLLPVKGRLQGKHQGCWGRIRPRAGSVKLRQPPVSHAQSHQPPVSP